jgi:hypothetical protein
MVEATGRGYTQSGAGEYPLSETEIRAMFLWMVTHPNISVVNSQDTSVPMHLRPPSTSKADESMYYTDNAYYLMFDEEGKAQSGYVFAGDVFWTYSNRSRLRAGQAPREGSSLFGHGPDYGYAEFGAIWYGDELWGNWSDYWKDFKARCTSSGPRASTHNTVRWNAAERTRSSGRRTHRQAST